MKLVSKSQSVLQSKLNDKDTQELLKNKSVSMLFLDKITKLMGEQHPDSVEAKKLMGGPHSLPSIELIRHLSEIIQDPSISPDVKGYLEAWITNEQACLPISLIFDAWQSVSEEIVDSAIGMGRKGDYEPPTSIEKIEPPPEEVAIFAEGIAKEMQNMQPGDRFKMPAGSLFHVTRLEISKK